MLHICPSDDCFHLTPTDQKLLDGLIEGLPNKAIGERAGLRKATVANRILVLRQAMGCVGTTRTEFAWAAMRVLHPDWNDPTRGLRN